MGIYDNLDAAVASLKRTALTSTAEMAGARYSGNPQWPPYSVPAAAFADPVHG